MRYLLQVLCLIIVVGCASSNPALRQLASIENGMAKADLIQLAGPPQDRQMQGDYEALQWCESGFVQSNYKLVWLYKNKVAGMNTYQVGGAAACEDRFKTVRWEEAPSYTVEVRGR